MTTQRWIWWATWIGVAIGAVGVTWLVVELGPSTIGRLVRSAGAVLALGVGLDLVATLLRARAVHIFLRPSQRMIRYPRVVVAQAAATAMQEVTPTGVLGDATKLTALLGRVPAPAAVSAIVIYDVVALQVSATILVSLTFVVAVWGDLPAALRGALWFTIALQVIGLTALTLLIRRGATTTILRALRVRSPAWLARAADLDGRLQELQLRSPAQRIEGFVLQLAARVVSWVELYALLRVFGVDPGAGLFATIILGQLPISRAASLIPLGVGVRDAGVTGLFVLLGLPAAAGASMVLVARIRTLATATIGIGALAVLQTYDRTRFARRAAELRARTGSPPVQLDPVLREARDQE